MGTDLTWCNLIWCNSGKMCWLNKNQVCVCVYVSVCGSSNDSGNGISIYISVSHILILCEMWHSNFTVFLSVVSCWKFLMTLRSCWCRLLISSLLRCTRTCVKRQCPRTHCCVSVVSRDQLSLQKSVTWHCCYFECFCSHFCKQFDTDVHRQHAQLNRHLSIMGLVSDPLCNQCGVAIDSASHFLCQCDGFITLRRKLRQKSHLHPADIDHATARDLERFIKKSHRFTQKP